MKNKIQDIHVPISFACNDIDVAIQHCVAGFGIGVFLSYQVESLIRQDVLVEILREFRQKSIPVSMIYPSAKRHLTRTSFFIDFAKETLRAKFDSGFAKNNPQT